MGDFLSRESLIIGGTAAGITFILTFFAGLFGGVALLTLLFRSILFTTMLGILGIVIAKILEKVIPDIWDMESSDNANSSKKETLESSAGIGVDYTVSDTPFKDIKTEFSHEGKTDHGSISHVSLEEAEAHGRTAKIVENKSKTKPRVKGKYLIVDDKKFPNEPDDYAKAIRTMMKRDE